MLVLVCLAFLYEFIRLLFSFSSSLIFFYSPVPCLFHSSSSSSFFFISVSFFIPLSLFHAPSSHSVQSSTSPVFPRPLDTVPPPSPFPPIDLSRGPGSSRVCRVLLSELSLSLFIAPFFYSYSSLSCSPWICFLSGIRFSCQPFPPISPDTLLLATLLMRRPVSLPVCLRPRLSVLQDPCRILDGGQMFLVALPTEWTDCVSIAPPRFSPLSCTRYRCLYNANW